MPYRVDIARPRVDTLDRLIDLGALDVAPISGGGVAAILPDAVSAAQLTAALGLTDPNVRLSPAVGRDAGSIWILEPRPVQVGRLRIVPAGTGTGPMVLQLADGAAFGTGLHPTTVLCLEALQDVVDAISPAAVLDVGTGSGILALAAVMLGVPRAVGVDIDVEALRVAARNGEINGVADRLRLLHGGPAAVTGSWPLVLANVLAAPLVEMAPLLARRVGHRGQLVLSGISSGLEAEVTRAYERQGLLRLQAATREGWFALLMQASW